MSTPNKIIAYVPTTTGGLSLRVGTVTSSANCVPVSAAATVLLGNEQVVDLAVRHRAPVLILELEKNAE